VLAIRRQVQRQPLTVVAGGITLQPAGGLEGADHLGPTAFDGLDRGGQLGGLRQRRQQRGEQN
jgi:hypothetical protein